MAIARDSKFLGFQVSLTANLVIANQGAVQKPDRWRETVSFNIGIGTSYASRKMLQLRTYEYIREYWPDPTSLDEPEYYAEWADNYWLVGPSADVAYPFEVICYMTPTQLTASANENWLTQYAPDMLLWQTLLQAAPFLKNDSRIPTWETRYNQARDSQRAEFAHQIVDRVQMVEGA